MEIRASMKATVAMLASHPLRKLLGPLALGLLNKPSSWPSYSMALNNLPEYCWKVLAGMEGLVAAQGAARRHPKTADPEVQLDCLQQSREVLEGEFGECDWLRLMTRAQRTLECNQQNTFTAVSLLQGTVVCAPVFEFADCITIEISMVVTPEWATRQGILKKLLGGVFGMVTQMAPPVEHCLLPACPRRAEDVWLASGFGYHLPEELERLLNTRAVTDFLDLLNPAPMPKPQEITGTQPAADVLCTPVRRRRGDRLATQTMMTPSRPSPADLYPSIPGQLSEWKDVLKLWDADINRKSPSDIAQGSDGYVHLACGGCVLDHFGLPCGEVHRWLEKISNLSSTYKCKRCHGKYGKIESQMCLCKTVGRKPELADSWANTMEPLTVSLTANEDYTWVCERCREEGDGETPWRASSKNCKKSVAKGKGCGVCARRKRSRMWARPPPPVVPSLFSGGVGHLQTPKIFKKLAVHRNGPTNVFKPLLPCPCAPQHGCPVNNV